jgi:VWFA-related protein
VAVAQTQPRPDKSTAAKQPSIFQSRVNLVLVPVVVRDAQGRAVGNLTKDDFEIYDKGKRQSIASFSAIARPLRAAGSSSGTVVPAETSTLQPVSGSNPAVPRDSPPRYILYLFDDVHTRFAPMANVHDAALRHFRTNLAPGDRAAIYTFSGDPTLEFTDDRAKLEQAVSKLAWRPQAGSGEAECPDVSYYMADQVVIKADEQALAALINHTAECAHVPPDLARAMAWSAANRALIIGMRNTSSSLRTLRGAIRRLSGMPGQRVIMLASPGFFAQTDEAIKGKAELLDLAAKSEVVINALNVRGVVIAPEEENVATSTGFGRRRPPTASSPKQLWLQYRYENARTDDDLMKELAESTGGTVFHNNNDLGLGLEKLSAAPAFSYILAFSPAGLKTDGSFHSLKVRLTGRRGLNIEARPGYYALTPDESEKAFSATVDDAIFSRAEIADIPVVVQTGYSKPYSSENAKVQIITKIDLTALHFREAAGRNAGRLTVVAALFDTDGGFVSGETKTVNLKLLDQTLSQKDTSLTLRFDLDAKAGSYAVRLVIGEPSGKAMTALNRSVKIL